MKTNFDTNLTYEKHAHTSYNILDSNQQNQHQFTKQSAEMVRGPRYSRKASKRPRIYLFMLERRRRKENESSEYTYDDEEPLPHLLLYTQQFSIRTRAQDIRFLFYPHPTSFLQQQSVFVAVAILFHYLFHHIIPANFDISPKRTNTGSTITNHPPGTVPYARHHIICVCSSSPEATPCRWERVL